MLERIPILAPDTSAHPVLRYYEDALSLSESELTFQKQSLLPDFNIALFHGINNGPGTNAFSGFEAGVAIPIWLGANKSKMAAIKTDALILASEKANFKAQMTARYLSLLSDIRSYEGGLFYYESVGKNLSEETLVHAVKAFQNGEINYLQYIQLLENAVDIEINYLNTLFQYNHTALEINYLMH